MLVILIISTLLPLMSAAAETIDFSKPYTSFPIGCHTFEGLVLCANGNKVLPDAKAILYEKDPFVDDKLAEVQIKDSRFVIQACAKDFPTPNLELFLKFENACQKDATKQSGLLKEHFLMEYVIHDEDQFAHTAINV